MTLFGNDQQPLLWLTGCAISGQQGRGAGHQEAQRQLTQQLMARGAHLA